MQAGKDEITTGDNRMKLSKDFYKKLDKTLKENMVNKENISIIQKIDWNKEADRCLKSLKSFFDQLDFDQFKDDEVGVVDIRWNEYGGDIEIDFMPDNDFDTAFDQGCIMNSSAIDNDEFFIEYFDCMGEESHTKVDDDYFNLIYIFYLMFHEIIPVLIKDSCFKDLPRKTPYYISFAFSHDDKEPGILFPDNKDETNKKEMLRKKILETFKAYSDKKYFNLKLEPVSKVMFLGSSEDSYNFCSLVSKENGDEIFNTCDDFNLSSFFEDGLSESAEENFDRASEILSEIIKESSKTEEFQSIPKDGAIEFELKLLGVKQKVLCCINPDGTVVS